jgi:hypothetical protein
MKRANGEREAGRQQEFDETPPINIGGVCFDGCELTNSLLCRGSPLQRVCGIAYNPLLHGVHAFDAQ